MGEGMDLGWPGSDWSILGLVVAYWVIATVAVPICRPLLFQSAGDFRRRYTVAP
jgi:hypothetical protein